MSLLDVWNVKAHGAIGDGSTPDLDERLKNRSESSDVWTSELAQGARGLWDPMSYTWAAANTTPGLRAFATRTSR